MKKSFHLNNFFKVFFLSYSLIVFLLVLMGGIMLRFMYQTVEEEVQLSNMTVLSGAGSSIDKTMEEIDNIISRLALDSKIQAFTKLRQSAEGSPDIIIAKDAWQKIAEYKINLTNRYIVDLGIYSDMSDVIVSSVVPYSKAPYYYGSVIQFSDLDFSAWKKAIIEPYHNHASIPVSPMRLYGRTYDVITYLQSLPLGSIESHRATMFIYIDTKQIGALLDPILKNQGSILFIQDKQDNILCSFGDKSAARDINGSKLRQWLLAPGDLQRVELDGDSYLLSSYQSPYNQWRYCALVPQAGIRLKLDPIRRTLWWQMLLTLLISVTLALFFSWRNAMPLNEISQLVSRALGAIRQDKKGSYLAMKGSINQLVQMNTDMKTKMGNLNLLVRDGFFRQLLSNGYSSATEMRMYAESPGINLQFPWFLCAVIRFPTLEEASNAEELQYADFVTLVLSEAMHELNRNSHLVRNGKNQHVIVYCSSMESEEAARIDFQEYGQHLMDEMEKTMNIVFQLDIGIAVDDPMNLYLSHQTCVSIGEFRSLNSGAPILFYKDTTAGQYGVKLSIDTMLLIEKYVREGNTISALREINFVLMVNLDHRNLSPESFRLLFDMLLASACRLNDELDMANRASISMELSRHVDKAAVSKTILAIYANLCDRFGVCNNPRTKLKNDIVAYVEKNHPDPDLSTYSISREFNMSENAVCLFFKKTLELSFADYLENMRIERACRLLVNHDINVVDLAEKVGYLSAHSFRRAFKRIKEATPTEYRKSVCDISSLKT